MFFLFGLGFCAARSPIHGLHVSIVSIGARLVRSKVATVRGVILTDARWTMAQPELNKPENSQESNDARWNASDRLESRDLLTRDKRSQ